MSKIHSSSRLSLALACVLAACADGTDTTMDTNNAGGNNGGGWNGGGGDTGGGNNGGGWNGGGGDTGGGNNGGGWNDGGGTGGGGTGGGGTGGGGSGGPFCGGNAPETTSYNYQDNVPASQNPPGGIPVNEAPLFISFGWDDNSRPDSMNWAVDMAAARKNPDGSPIQMTFFYTTTYLGTGAVADPKALKAAWKRAMDSGHEVGLHSITHATSKNTSREQWTTEITGCIDALTKPYDANEEGWDILQKSGIGAPREIIYGWRTPFLGTNDDFLPVLKEQGIWYDASMEEGFQYDQDGTNFVWPYTLDNGSPGDELIHSWGPNEYKSPITKHPGLWELPVYVFVVPPELRGGPLSERQPWFQPEDFKITGFDYNLMVSFKMNKDEYLATLKYTLDQRLRGNRAPMLIGVHTDYYDATYNAAPNMTYEERRAAIEEFVDYALSFPEVRFKSYKQVFDWMRNPSPLTGCN